MFGCDKISDAKNDLLSICIPTYNHAEPLRKCLEAMVPQAKQHNIPIYVSDNASTDDTLEVLKSFSRVYQFLYFKTNNENAGVDQNMVSAARMASSKYVWTFGSRRILLPGMLNKIYTVLEDSNLDLLVLNDLNSKYTVPESKKYSSAREVFRELNRNLTGLGFQILPLEAWKSSVALKYDGTEWTVFGLTLEFVAEKKDLNVFFISEPCATSSGESHWKPKCFQIWANWKKVVNSLPEIYSKEDKEFVIRKSVNYFFAGPNFDLINLRANSIYNSDVFNAYREDLTHYGSLSPNIAYAISRFPVQPLKLYYKLYSATRTIARMFIRQKAPLNPTRRQVIAYS